VTRKTQWRMKAMIVAAGAAFALPALAQRDMSYGNQTPGFYAGASVGANGDQESAWRILGGYSVNRNWALELGYHDTGETDIHGVPADTHVWELVGVGKWPIDERFSLYGKLGAYRGKAEGQGIEETNTDLTFGAGVEYALNRQTAVRGEWQRYSDMGGGPFPGTTDVDVLNVGVIYRFQ